MTRSRSSRAARTRKIGQRHDAVVQQVRRSDFALSWRKLITLKDAGNYITKLPKAEHDTPEWRASDVRYGLIR